jgi:hypothetical protein
MFAVVRSKCMLESLKKFIVRIAKWHAGTKGRQEGGSLFARGAQ